jgi:uncharacterized protein YecE (DUF72 family)
MIARGRAYVGTSGWSYAHWRGLFYPDGVPANRWINHYAASFATVELNASFYRLPKPATIARWAELTPAGFVFAVKASRLITHYRRLKDCQAPLAELLDRVGGFGAKLGPILFQLPPRLALDLEVLSAFLAALPKGQRYAFEFRDPAWHDARVYDLLARYAAAFCLFELGAARAPRIVTADFVYVRLHGRAGRYRGCYSAAALAAWAKWLNSRLIEGKDVYVYFDNTDVADYAVRNALSLRARLEATPPRGRRHSQRRTRAL